MSGAKPPLRIGTILPAFSGIIKEENAPGIFLSL
jgi:hypothetical protein